MMERRRRRLILDAPWVLALAVLLPLAQLIWSSYRETLGTAQTRITDYAAMLEAQLDATLRRADSNLLKIVRTTPAAALSRAEASRQPGRFRSEWGALLTEFPELGNLAIFDARGDLLYSSMDGTVQANIADRAHFRRLKADPDAGLVFSETFTAHSSGRAGIALARALRDERGAFIGEAVALLDLVHLERLFRTLNVGAGGNVSLWRSDNFSLALRHPPLPDKLNVPLPAENPARALLAPGVRSASLELTASSDGRLRYYAYRTLERHPFFVSVGVAKDEVLAGWKDRSLAVGLSALLLVGLMMWLLYRLWGAEVARQSAAATSRRLAAIVENSHDAIVGTDADGRIFGWNAAAEDLFGYGAEEAIGMNIARLVPREVMAEMVRKRAQRTASRAVLDMEGQRRRKDGSMVDVSIRVSNVLDDAGALVGDSLIYRDISGRKRADAERAALEEQLRESQKMQAVGTLAGGIAHDFNNILAIILGNTDLARQDLSNHPEALTSLNEIHSAGTRARELVRQILAFSRRQPTERRPMALEPVIGEAVRLLRATLPARIELRVEYEPRAPMALVDPVQIGQALINLATNAMQAMPEGDGCIRIALDKVNLDDAGSHATPALHALHRNYPGPVLRLVVSDNGKGMDAATLKRIFEPFFTTRAVNEGTGLGLSVVHGIVHAHEGAIGVESDPGRGTVFTIHLPAAPGAAAGSRLDAVAGLRAGA